MLAGMESSHQSFIGAIRDLVAHEIDNIVDAQIRGQGSLGGAAG